MDNHEIKTPSVVSKRIIGLVVFSFLITFILARLFVYLVLGRLMPNFFLTIHGVHVHHFTYGVVILVIVGLYLLLRRPPDETDAFRWSALFYGIGLGLTFDEFGMWIMLRDDYWLRQSYDAVIIMVLILLNVAFYQFTGKLLNILFIRQIKKVYAFFKLS